MASNYSSDPRNISSIGNAAMPQNQRGPVREVPQTSPISGGEQSLNSPSTNGGNMNLSGPKRLPVGTTLSGARYTIESLIAQGGMGAVYRAVDTRLNRTCAVTARLDECHQES